MTNGEAWLYKYARATCGASFAFWRRTWERKPFPDLPKGASTGEDWAWAQGLNFKPLSCLLPSRYEIAVAPRLICSIHGSNSGNYDIEDSIAKGSREWTRAPQWDNYCREKMRL